MFAMRVAGSFADRVIIGRSNALSSSVRARPLAWRRYAVMNMTFITLAAGTLVDARDLNPPPLGPITAKDTEPWRLEI